MARRGAPLKNAMAAVEPKMLELCGREATGTITRMAGGKPCKSMSYREYGRCERSGMSTSAHHRWGTARDCQ
jgi:hypothetical protein